MPGTLLTGAAGYGKTQAAISHIKSMLNHKLFGKIWVLLPTELQISTFRTRLMQEMGDSAHFGVEFFDFYDLYARLLELANIPQRRVKDAARFRILRHVLDDVATKLRHFNTIAHMPGFLALAADFIRELKQAEITPEHFLSVANTPKDHDLALIYEGYQTFLRSQYLVDSEGEGWLALAQFEDGVSMPLNVDLLLIDGYDQFNPVQARLLGQLVASLPETFLTLTYEADRAETAHRRFAQTFAQLTEAGDWHVKTLTLNAMLNRSATLAHLTRHLFDIFGESINNDGAVSMVEAPDRQREVQTVLRRVKRLLLDGTAPDEIAIVARSLEPYNAYFLETAPAYGVPLAVRHGAPLKENPAVAAFLGLIDLHADDFRRRSVMDALHSPYLESPDLIDVQIDKLDLVSRGRIVIRGCDEWLNAIEAAGKLKSNEDEVPLDALSPDEAVQLRNVLSRFFDRTTPIETATARQYVRWLEALIGPDPVPFEEPSDEDEAQKQTTHFNVLSQIRNGIEPALVARDLAAIETLKRVMLDVLSAYELVDPYADVDWATFRLDLQTAIDNACVNTARMGSRTGRVLLASVFEARGLPHDHIFMLGLSEGEFPARAPENSLYSDDERRQLQARQLPILTRAEAADETSLFYEMTALAKQSFTLTRSYIDERSNDWPASPFWRAVQQLVEVEVERLPIAAAIRLEEAARLSEAMLALAQSLSGKLSEPSSAAHNWMVSQAELSARWANALRGRKIEMNRAARGIAHNAHTGHLFDPVLRKIVAEMLGPERLWSASQFNEYGICPYRFFAKRMLRLEVLEEPEEGMDQLQLGTLYHEILEYTYRQIAYEELVIGPENQAKALAILDQMLDRFLRDAPERHGFRETALWPHEQIILRRKLRSLVALDFSSDSPLIKKFGEATRHNIRQEVRFGWDNQQAMVLDGPAGPLKVRGQIDRVDQIGNQAIVIDYKSGSGKITPDDMVEGRNIQMMLYIYAAPQVMHDNEIEGVAGGTFWHIGSEEISKPIMGAASELEDARVNLHERIIAGRQGIFVNTPSKRTNDGHCSGYCEFSQLCRVDRGSNAKPIEQRPI
jgi:ATP-dependent helicase/nuclease subunit B